jgi:hypothetical protein
MNERKVETATEGMEGMEGMEGGGRLAVEAYANAEDLERMGKLAEGTLHP